MQQQIADENQLYTSSQVYVGGGTDLFVQRPEAMAKSDVHLLYGQPKLKGIWLENGHCHIGGGTTIEEMRQSELMHSMFPRLMPHTKLVSSSPIRNMATVAGNFVNGSPIGDLTIFFLALDSTVILERDGRTRELKLRHLYKGYKTLDRHPAEKLTGLYFEAPDATTHFNFEKVSKRTHLDIASVNTALQLRVSGGIITCAHLSAGGVGPIPLYLSQASAYLAGRPVSEQTLHQAANLAQQEIAPISDARGTEAYKRLLLRQLISAHFLTLFPKDITPACIAFA